MLSENKLTNFQYVGIRRKNTCSQKATCSLHTDIHNALLLDTYITPPAHCRALTSQSLLVVLPAEELTAIL